jgi:hypothetical protein
MPSARSTVFETICVHVLKAHKIYKVYKLNNNLMTIITIIIYGYPGEVWTTKQFLFLMLTDK